MLSDTIHGVVKSRAGLEVWEDRVQCLSRIMVVSVLNTLFSSLFYLPKGYIMLVWKWRLRYVALRNVATSFSWIGLHGYKTVDDEQDFKLAFILFYIIKIAQRYTADMISVACNSGFRFKRVTDYLLQQHQSYLSTLSKLPKGDGATHADSV